MSVEIRAPALIPPPMMKWSRVKLDVVVDLVVSVVGMSLVGVSVAVRVSVELVFVFVVLV